MEKRKSKPVGEDLDRFKLLLPNLLEYWLVELRLQDWNVRAGMATQLQLAQYKEKFDIVFPFGQTKTNTALKEAAVLISPVCEPDILGEKDFEITLVHELLHLHARPFDHLILDSNGKEKKSCPSEFEAFEFMIESLAQALVRIRRRGKVKIPGE